MCILIPTHQKKIDFPPPVGKEIIFLTESNQTIDSKGSLVSLLSDNAVVSYSLNL